MIALCTASPTADYDGDYVTVTVPSGKEVVQIALTPQQAILLAIAANNAGVAAFKELVAGSAQSAEILRFPKQYRRNRRYS
ncbi:hypothetical protein ACFO0A_00645 [Novosphingobium tardum]|uniref:Uncharacterized protein n=1 Tax=Novosphingobium tardum TaxID=1538021 RepID=A0ABV8RJZ0_9SPHN